MKAGGIMIVSTCVFWIHHEEIEGQWNWSDNRDLGEFVRLAGSVGLKVIVRCGSWDHGEVRNGGFSEWLAAKDWNLRSTAAHFLERVRLLYGQIAGQLRGHLWRNGGAVIGTQLDNEFEGPAKYLMALKKIARDVGPDVPIYTRTGWTKTTTPLVFGKVARWRKG
jgi:beta-galactosidase